MKKYRSIKKRIHKLNNSFKMVTDAKINNLKKNYPLLPDGYCDFLKEIGYGRLGDGFFQFYSGLVEYDEFFNNINDETKDLLLFGDDYQGYCSGFDPNNNWSIIEVSAIEPGVTRICDTFEEFLESIMESIE